MLIKFTNILMEKEVIMKTLKSVRPNDLKESNRVSILNLIRSNKYSRADISGLLGLSKPTVSSIVEELIRENLVVEVGQGIATDRVGKKPTYLGFNAKAGLIVAININQNTCDVAVTDLAANIIARRETPTNIFRDYRKTLDEIVNQINILILDIPNKALSKRIIACGIAFKGLVNSETGIMHYSASFPHWKDVPIGEYFSNSLKIPVFIENNARAITFAEMQFGRGSGKQYIVCVSMSIGIGTGVVMNNDVYRGANSGAVTFGHTIVLENGPECQCGNRGCWESLASPYALLRELKAKDPKYAKMHSFKQVMKEYNTDPVIRDLVLNYTCFWLGVGIANLLNTFNPQMLIIQGEITSIGEELRKKIEEVALARTLPLNRNVEICFSSMSENIEIIGATSVVINKFFSPENHMDLSSILR